MKNIFGILFFLALTGLAQAQYNPYNGITVAGGNGLGDTLDQLATADDVYVDANGNIFVVDGGNERVMEFPANSTSTTYGTVIAGGNGPGSDSNQLNGPVALYGDSSGNIYVVDEGNDRVQEFPPGSTSATDGITVAGGNGPGNANNQLDAPSAIYVDHSGNLYIADQNNNRILKFPAGGTPATNGVTVAGNNTGAGNTAANQLYLPAGVFVDDSGYLYVSDAGNERVQKFPPNSDSTTSAVTVAGGNDTGNAGNQLYNPAGIFVDRYGNLFVADNGNNRVQEFPQGSTSSTYGVTVAGVIDTDGIQPYGLNGPTGVCLDNELNLYVADNNDERVQEFLYTGTGITTVNNEHIAMAVAPNPFSQNTLLTLELPVAGQVQVQVFDVVGQEIQVLNTNLQAGTSMLTVANNLEAGTYFLKLTCGSFSNTLRIVSIGK